MRPDGGAAGPARLTLAQRRERDSRIMCGAWRDEHGLIRVMAVSDGYAMVRRPGCVPFVAPASDFGISFQIDDSAGRDALGAREGDGA